VIAEAFAVACRILGADRDTARNMGLRTEIAAALLEVGMDKNLDSASMARVAVDLVFIDEVEINLQ
jgi:hypothetical protein